MIKTKDFGAPFKASPFFNYIGPLPSLMSLSLEMNDSASAFFPKNPWEITLSLAISFYNWLWNVTSLGYSIKMELIFWLSFTMEFPLIRLLKNSVSFSISSFVFIMLSAIFIKLILSLKKLSFIYSISSDKYSKSGSLDDVLS